MLAHRCCIIQCWHTVTRALLLAEAVPKRILDLMNVEGLTRENVASHLQVTLTYLLLCLLARPFTAFEHIMQLLASESCLKLCALAQLATSF